MHKKPSNRSFGLLLFFILMLIGLWPLIKNDYPNFYLINLSLIFLFLGIKNSNILTPLNRVWIKFGEILGTIIAPIVMALIYFVILTPISLVIRITGKDLIGLKFSKKKSTYWIKKKKQLGTMDKQF